MMEMKGKIGIFADAMFKQYENWSEEDANPEELEVSSLIAVLNKLLQTFRDALLDRQDALALRLAAQCSLILMVAADIAEEIDEKSLDKLGALDDELDELDDEELDKDEEDE